MLQMPCQTNKEVKVDFISELDKVWEQLLNTYTTTFKDLVYEDFPTEQEVYASLLFIKEKINAICWLKNE